MPVPNDILQLVGAVPRPPGDGIPPGASDDDIAAFSARTGLEVPNELGEWLRFTNGPSIGPGGFHGIKPARTELDIEESLRLFPEWKCENSIPVAGDGTGNYYLLAGRGRFAIDFPVFFFDHELGNSADARYIVASDLWHFIRFILRKELGERGWPFSKEKVLLADEGILRCKGIKLPWDT